VDSRDPKEAEVSALGDTAASDPSVSPALAGTIASDSHVRPVTSAESALRPFGPFGRVERLAEQGGMGVVARGYNEAFDRWELLKFLHPDLSNQPEFVRQFFREGRVLARLSHPNIVQVFATYALDGRPCLAMEFLEGVSLAALVAKERSPIARWHELFLAAARGLAAAHDVGLLHRDIKPENLFVVHDRAGAPKSLKLIDFGLATADRSRRADPTHDPSLVAGMGGGTPLYMAPELWMGEEASPRTDVYSLGQSFFVALTGRLPFVGETVAQVCLAVCSEEPFPDARELRPDLPAPLALVIRRAIAKRKDDRIATADELVAALVAAAGAARARRVPGSGPYRGLGSYSAAERDVFFGRDTEVARSSSVCARKAASCWSDRAARERAPSRRPGSCPRSRRARSEGASRTAPSCSSHGLIPFIRWLRRSPAGSHRPRTTCSRSFAPRRPGWGRRFAPRCRWKPAWSSSSISSRSLPPSQRTPPRCAPLRWPLARSSRSGLRPSASSRRCGRISWTASSRSNRSGPS
jgi:serine/threonine protein kinase